MKLKNIIRKWLGVDFDYKGLRIVLEERTRPNPYQIGEDVVFTHTFFANSTVSPAKVVAFKINHTTLMWEYTVFDGKALHTAREHELSKKPQSSINDEIKLSGGPFTIAPQNTETITIKGDNINFKK